MLYLEMKELFERIGREKGEIGRVGKWLVVFVK